MRSNWNLNQNSQNYINLFNGFIFLPSIDLYFLYLCSNLKTIGWLLLLRSGRTVSFSEMCHPNMSGGKQRPIRRQGRCHHWLLNLFFACEWFPPQPFKWFFFQGPMMATTLLSDWPFFPPLMLGWHISLKDTVQFFLVAHRCARSPGTIELDYKRTA